MAMKKQVLFSVENGIYGLDVSEVMGIEKERDIVNVPNAPCDIRGIINLRGEVLPVYSLRNKFNLDERGDGEPGEFIIVKSHGVPLALDVDAVKEIVEINDEQVSEMPAVVMNEHTSYAESVAHIDKSLVLLLNLDGLLSEEQKEQLNKFMKSVN